MAGFKTHAAAGIVAGTAFAVFTGMRNWTALPQSAIAAVLFAAGAVFPDIDSDTGKPKKVLFGILAIVLPFLLLRHFRNVADGEQLFLIVTAAFLAVHFPVTYLFERFTVHRGIFHSVPLAVILAEGIFLLFAESAPAARMCYAAAGFCGCLTHLLLDEFCSAAGAKKSLGSAFKFTGGSPVSTAFAYGVLLILGGLCGWFWKGGIQWPCS